MLDKISETIWAIVMSVPAWFVPEGSKLYGHPRHVRPTSDCALRLSDSDAPFSVSDRIRYAKDDHAVQQEIVVALPSVVAFRHANEALVATSGPSYLGHR